MDNIFGVGLPELILILIIAGIIMGPERIVVGARWLGKTTSQLQGVSRSFFRQLNAEVDNMDPTGELKQTMDELSLLRRQVDEMRAEFIGATTGINTELRRTVQEIEDEVGTIAPPSLLAGRKVAESRNAAQPSPINGQSGVYRPPSLLEPPPESNGQSRQPSPPPIGLPQRLDTSDDPE